MNQKFFLFMTLISQCLLSSLCSEDSKDKAKSEQPQQKPEISPQEILKEEVVETDHVIKIGGIDLHYQAKAGSFPLKNDKGKVIANIFYVSYTKKDEKDLSKRPITFCFNGGPGSSSIWLHMGLLGPKKVLLKDTESSSLPYQIADNEHSLLGVTDLVFIDPVSTGYSAPASGEDAKQFHGVEEDIHAVAEFIRLYTTHFNRWGSPKFLAGESYGTTRAVGLAGYLHNDLHLDLNGIMLISSVLNFQTLDDRQNANDLPYPLFLPTYAATAWYHKKLDKELQSDLHQTLDKVQEFAMNEYHLALMKGESLSEKERAHIVQQLSRYTGLSTEYLEKSNLRVKPLRFMKELLHHEKRIIGRFDSRYKGIDRQLIEDCIEYDPSAEAVFGVFTATFNHYLRTDLKWEKDDQYKVISNVFPWNYGSATNAYLTVTNTLQEAMTKNPALKVFIASGYFDLATPYFATDYTLNHLGLDSALKPQIKNHYYEAGHMMYVNPTCCVNLSQDLADFVTSSAIPAKKK